MKLLVDFWRFPRILRNIITKLFLFWFSYHCRTILWSQQTREKRGKTINQQTMPCQMILLFFVLVHNLTFKSCRCTQKWYIISLVTLKYLLNWFKLVELKYVQLSRLFKVPIFYLYVPIPPMQKHIGRKGQTLHWKLGQ